MNSIKLLKTNDRPNRLKKTLKSALRMTVNEKKHKISENEVKDESIKVLTITER